MPDDGKKLERFIEKLLQAKNTRKKLTNSELELLAFEMGITQSEWKEILKSFDAHLTRAKGFMQYQNWDDAILELNQAQTINPYHEETLYLLALSHKKRYDETKKLEDRTKARNYAQECLELNPSNSQAIKLISDFKVRRKSEKIPNKQKDISGHSRNNTVSEQKTGQSKKKTVLALSIGILLLLGGIIAFLTVKDAPNRNIEVQKPKDSKTESVSKTDEKEVNTDIPVIFVADEKSENINFKLESIEFKPYKNSYSIGLKADLLLENIELKQLELKVQFISQNDEIILAGYKEVISKHSPTFRHKDIAPLGFSKYVKDSKMPNFKEVRVSVNQLIKQPAAPSYEISAAVETTWEAKRPPNYNVKIRERFSNLSKGYGDNLYHKIVFEAENTGSSNIKTLQVVLKWIDKNGKMVESKTTYFNSSSNPDIKRGQTRVYGGTWSTTKLKLADYDHYEISILRID